MFTPPPPRKSNNFLIDAPCKQVVTISVRSRIRFFGTVLGLFLALVMLEVQAGESAGHNGGLGHKKRGIQGEGEIEQTFPKGKQANCIYTGKTAKFKINLSGATTQWCNANVLEEYPIDRDYADWTFTPDDIGSPDGLDKPTVTYTSTRGKTSESIVVTATIRARPHPAVCRHCNGEIPDSETKLKTWAKVLKVFDVGMKVGYTGVGGEAGEKYSWRYKHIDELKYTIPVPGATITTTGWPGNTRTSQKLTTGVNSGNAAYCLIIAGVYDNMEHLWTTIPGTITADGYVEIGDSKIRGEYDISVRNTAGGAFTSTHAQYGLEILALAGGVVGVVASGGTGLVAWAVIVGTVASSASGVLGASASDSGRASVGMVSAGVVKCNGQPQKESKTDDIVPSGSRKHSTGRNRFWNYDSWSVPNAVPNYQIPCNFGREATLVTNSVIEAWIPWGRNPLWVKGKVVIPDMDATVKGWEIPLQFNESR